MAASFAGKPARRVRGRQSRKTPYAAPGPRPNVAEPFARLGDTVYAHRHRSTDWSQEEAVFAYVSNIGKRYITLRGLASMENIALRPHPDDQAHLGVSGEPISGWIGLEPTDNLSGCVFLVQYDGSYGMRRQNYMRFRVWDPAYPVGWVRNTGYEY